MVSFFTDRAPGPTRQRKLKTRRCNLTERAGRPTYQTKRKMKMRRWGSTVDSPEEEEDKYIRGEGGGGGALGFSQRRTHQKKIKLDNRLLRPTHQKKRNMKTEHWGFHKENSKADSPKRDDGVLRLTHQRQIKNETIGFYGWHTRER